MAIKFYKIKENGIPLPYGGFSNFSRHSFWLDDLPWPTTEHYFQAQKYKGTPRYLEINKAETPRIASDLGRDRSIPIRPDWEQIKDNVMRKCVLKKFQVHTDIRKILIDTGAEEIIEDSPSDNYWGIGPNGDGKNMLGKILMETREYLKEFKHCLTCGTTHHIKDPCPPEAFVVLTCSCGNEDLMPGDALCMGIQGMFCGKCDKDTDWKTKLASIEDMKRLWKGYGEIK
jgi:N-glycosidase YbiA